MPFARRPGKTAGLSLFAGAAVWERLPLAEGAAWGFAKSCRLGFLTDKGNELDYAGNIGSRDCSSKFGPPFQRKRHSMEHRQ